MKSINQIFKGNEHLMDLNPIAELINYTQQLENNIIENNQAIDQTVKLKQLIKEINDDTKKILEDSELSKRWPQEFQSVDFESAIRNLLVYIVKYCKDERIWL